MEICNNVLERELSAYRFVGGRITEVSSKVEISEIEEALEPAPTLLLVNTVFHMIVEWLYSRDFKRMVV